MPLKSDGVVREMDDRGGDSNVCNKKRKIIADQIQWIIKKDHFFDSWQAHLFPCHLKISKRWKFMRKGGGSESFFFSPFYSPLLFMQEMYECEMIYRLLMAFLFQGTKEWMRAIILRFRGHNWIDFVSLSGSRNSFNNFLKSELLTRYDSFLCPFLHLFGVAINH